MQPQQRAEAALHLLLGIKALSQKTDMELKSQERQRQRVHSEGEARLASKLFVSIRGAGHPSNQLSKFTIHPSLPLTLAKPYQLVVDASLRFIGFDTLLRIHSRDVRVALLALALRLHSSRHAVDLLRQRSIGS